MRPGYRQQTSIQIINIHHPVIFAGRKYSDFEQRLERKLFDTDEKGVGLQKASACVRYENVERTMFCHREVEFLW